MKAKESSQPGRTHSTAIFFSQNLFFFISGVSFAMKDDKERL
jgi:hypothetical protein